MAKKKKNNNTNTPIQNNSNNVEKVLESIESIEKEIKKEEEVKVESAPLTLPEPEEKVLVKEEETKTENTVFTLVEPEEKIMVMENPISMVKEEEVKEDTKEEEKAPEELVVIGTLQKIPGQEHLITNKNITVSEPKAVNDATGTQKVITKTETKKKRNYRLGAPVDLENEPIYSGPYATVPKKKLTGRYYIYDGIEKNGFYRITDTKAHVNKDLKWIIGYIKK